MAILQRSWTVVKSNLNHLIGRAEDPEKMLNQMLLDMQEQLIDAKKQVAVAIADEKRLRKQFEQEKKLSEEWEQKAMLAIKAGNDELAKQALDRKTDHDKHAEGFKEQWTGQKNAVDGLKKALKGLSNKIGDAKRKKNLLVARAKRAQAQKTISETMSGISSTGGFETIERMEEKIDRMEAEASATTEMANEIDVDELAMKFDKLEVTKSDDALAALKQKMGVGAAANAPSAQDDDAIKAIKQEIDAEVQAKR